MIESVEILNGLVGRSAIEVFGDIDAAKLRSCLTLFARASANRDVFTRALNKYFGGEQDPLTLGLLGRKIQSAHGR